MDRRGWTSLAAIDVGDERSKGASARCFERKGVRRGRRGRKVWPVRGSLGVAKRRRYEESRGWPRGRGRAYGGYVSRSGVYAAVPLGGFLRAAASRTRARRVSGPFVPIRAASHAGGLFDPEDGICRPPSPSPNDGLSQLTRGPIEPPIAIACKAPFYSLRRSRAAASSSRRGSRRASNRLADSRARRLESRKRQGPRARVLPAATGAAAALVRARRGRARAAEAEREERNGEAIGGSARGTRSGAFLPHQIASPPSRRRAGAIPVFLESERRAAEVA
ncbi:hypothetical protein KM043_000536 [Ampulex compressa]|nr:hypothetical protein KM043_000536 [Ampulex compressa]